MQVEEACSFIRSSELPLGWVCGYCDAGSRIMQALLKAAQISSHRLDTPPRLTPAALSLQTWVFSGVNSYLHVRPHSQEQAQVDTHGPDVCPGLAGDPEHHQLPLLVVLQQLAVVDGAHT